MLRDEHEIRLRLPDGIHGPAVLSCSCGWRHQLRRGPGGKLPSFATMRKHRMEHRREAWEKRQNPTVSGGSST